MNDKMSGLDQWKRDAAKYQQDFYTRLGDREWDLISWDREDQLRNKISGSFFSEPFNTCSGEQKKTILKVSKKVQELSDSNRDIYLGFVYVCILTKDRKNTSIHTVVRTRLHYKDEIYFVESDAERVYTGWKDYRNNNRLPKCWMCFPVDGLYKSRDNRVDVEYGESPACRRIFRFLGAAASVGTVASTAVLTTTVMFPPILAIEGPALATLIISGGYNFVRAVSQLYDRGSHQQPVSPLDEGAFRIWLEMIANIGGTSLGGVAVARGVIGLTSRRLTMAILRYACIGVNSFGAVLCVVNFVLKLKGGTLTFADIDHFVFLTLFIGNIVISHAIARQVIETIADEPHRIRNLFNMVKNTQFKKLKTLVNCVSFEFIIEQLTGRVAVMILRQSDMPSVAQALEALNSDALQLVSGSMSFLEFASRAVTKLHPFLNDLRNEITIAIEKLQKLCNKAYNDVLINSKKLLEHSNPARMAQIMEQVERPVNNLDVHDPKIMDSTTKVMWEFATRMAVRVDCETDRDFLNLCAFLAENVTREYDGRRIVAVSDGNPAISDSDKEHMFKEVIGNLDQSPVKYQLIDEYREIQEVAIKAQMIFEQPVYQSSEITMHYFITSSDFGSFNQFVYDAACELLDTEILFEEATIDLRNSLFVIQFRQKVLYFFFEIHMEKHEVEGMAVLHGRNFQCVQAT